MNIFRTSLARALAVALALPLFVLLAGCDVDSVDSTTSVLADNSGTIYNFAGLYMHRAYDSASTNGPPPLVYPNGVGNRPSGKLITSLRLLQYGSVLEAYDSASQTWSGSISSLQGGTATFSLRGRTTTGLSVEIAGTMVYADQQSTMDASWIEPAYYGTLSAKATVPPSATNSPVTGLSINPKSVTLNSGDFTEVFTASGGSGSYTWEVSSLTLGSVSPATGSSVTYTSTKVPGSNIITLRDSAGASTTATASYSTSVASNDTEDDAGGTDVTPPIPG